MVKLPKLFRAAAPLLPQEVWVSRRGKWEAIQLRSQFQRRGERLLYISLVLRRRRVCRTLTLRKGEATELLRALGIPAVVIEEASHFGGSKIQCVDLQGSGLARFEVVETAGPSEEHAESCGDGEAAAADGPPASHWCTAPSRPPAVLPAPSGTQCAEAAIFWDYENISLSGQEDVQAVSNALRAVCTGMGCRLTERRLYLGDMHACGKALRAELDQAGFTLVHCPRRGAKKEQVDKVSQSVSHYHTPSTELTAHTHTVLWSSLQVRGWILCRSTRRSSLTCSCTRGSGRRAARRRASCSSPMTETTRCALDRCYTCSPQLSPQRSAP